MNATADIEQLGVHQILDRAGLLESVEPQAAAALIDQMHRAAFPAGHIIFHEGDPGDRVYIIVAGKVKISLRGPGGRENLRALMGPTDVFGELAVFDPGPRTCTAAAITDVATVWLDRATLRAWMAAWPAIAEQLLQALSRRLRTTDDELIELVSSDVTARVARQLLALAERFGTPEGGAVRVAHDLTQDEMAQLVGADRTSVNRALRGFAARGWIVPEAKAVLIVAPDALARRAAAGSTRNAQTGRRRRPLRATA